MKLKSLTRSANCCWSPEEVKSGIYLAAGTTAQKVDASFSVSAQLEILSLDIASHEKELKPVATIQCDQRFHKIVWSPFGIQQNTSDLGILCGGTDNGSVQVYNVQRLVNNENPMIASYKDHTGPVHALDFNPFQPQLLASGSRESEIRIWDLSTTAVQPFQPGATSQPLEDVACVAWNRQVQHILASAMPSRCVVWDLRKSEPIIRVSDSSSRFRSKAVAWNPQVPTQLCLASEDDHCPWLQIWDLRFASSPVKTLERHSKGVLSISWHPKDQDMLVSCGKGGSVCIWNPNGAQGSELTSELRSTSSWNVEVQWCPRNPAVVSLSSLSGEVGIYSVLGGEHDGQGDVLKKAPSWLNGGVGAQFGFGGKLISFSKEHGTTVDVTQVVTDDSFISRVKKMEDALFKGEQSDFWAEKLESEQAQLWKFLQALGDAEPNKKLQVLLGFDKVAEAAPEAEDLSSAFDNAVTLNGVCKDTDSADKITKALVIGDVARSIDFCLKSRRFAEALFLADYAKDPLLKENIRKEFLNANRGKSMCRLVACVSSGLWEELAGLAPTDEWKTVVAAVLGHVTDFHRCTNLCAQIASKLWDEQQQESAILVSVIARDLVNLSKCYISLYGAPDSNQKLQDYMEVMTTAKVLTKSQNLPKEVSTIVGEYVKLLAEQGCLTTSLYYLNDLDTNDVALSQLRDRILHSQGTITSKLVNPSPKQENQFTRQISRNRTLSTASTHDHTTGYHDYNSNVFQPTHEPAHNAVSDPLRSRPLSRAGKYPALIDPSIKSTAPLYGGNLSYGDTYGHVEPHIPVPQYAAPAPIVPGNNVRSPSVLGHSTSFPGQPQYGQPAPFPDQISAYHGQQQQPQQAYGYYRSTSTPATANPPENLPNGNDYTRDVRYCAPGWNDPPPIRRCSKPAISPGSLAETAPIACPLPNAPEVVPESQYFTPQPQVQQFVPQQQQPVYGQGHSRVAEEPRIEKGPIPAEFDVFYTVFETLRTACLVLEDSQVRRKLDDVHVKLEHLADKLRQYALSETTLQNLQLIINEVQRHDYNNALVLFHYVAQTCNMSETSAFLPGIKTLITIALHNQIYI